MVHHILNARGKETLQNVKLMATSSSELHCFALLFRARLWATGLTTVLVSVVFSYCSLSAQPSLDRRMNIVATEQ